MEDRDDGSLVPCNIRVHNTRFGGRLPGWALGGWVFKAVFTTMGHGFKVICRPLGFLPSEGEDSLQLFTLESCGTNPCSR